MEYIQTFTQYDSNGNAINRISAEDASLTINPEEVRLRIERIKEVAQEQMNIVSNALRNIEPDTKDAIVVKGLDMSQNIEDICTIINQIPGIIEENIQGMYAAAESAHDKIQKNNNLRAEQEANKN